VANNYQLLKLTDAVLNKHQITYWAWAGTLLGAVRHQGFIPWDLDTDICIFAEDEERLFECAADFAAYDAYIQPCSGTKTHYRIKRVKNGQELFGHVDVFFMKNIQGKVHYIFDAEQQDNHFFWPSEIERLTRIPFGPILITVPENYMPYLYRGYGKDVMEMAQIMYTNNPRTGKPYPKFKLSNFRPALYEVIDFSIPLDDSPWFYN
jgi:lipopolysaccharide cholinephosphotransferase